jgi:hypothetical protein
MMPHLFWRPRTFLPFTTTVRSDPTTAKGKSSCSKSAAVRRQWHVYEAYPNGGLESSLLGVVLVVVVGVHAQVVELELLLYPLLEGSTLLEGQAVALGNDGNDVDELAQLLEHNNVNGLERVARGLDEEQAAVDAGVLEVSLTLGSELLAEVGTVLVLDVLDNGVPATLVVDQVTVAGCIDNVQAQTHAVLLNDVRDGVDRGRGAWLLIGLEATLAVHQMRREDGVDKCRLAETGLTCTDC